MKRKTLVLMLVIMTIVCAGGIFYMCCDNRRNNKAGSDSVSLNKALEAYIEKAFDADQIIHLNGVLPHDKKIAAEHDIPEQELSKTPTDILCRHFVGSPMRVWFGMYDDVNFGITRAIRASATLSALINREDMVEGMIKMYSETIIDPENTQAAELGSISMALMASDELLTYPPIFERTKGYGKDLLLHLCNRYKRMREVNEKCESKGENPPYGASLSSARKVALLLLKRFDNKLYDKWQDQFKDKGKLTKDEDRLFEEIEQQLKTH